MSEYERLERLKVEADRWIAGVAGNNSTVTVAAASMGIRELIQNAAINAARSESRSQDPAQSVPDGMWYFTFYCEDRASVERMRVIADAPRQFTCGVTGIAKKEKANG